MAVGKGHLVIIGGAEDKEDDKAVLEKVVELAGGKGARLVVLSTASRQAGKQPEVACEFANEYERAFCQCGAAEVTTLHVHDRHTANDPAVAKLVARATGVFMTGGDQSRLVSILGGTAVWRAMHEVYHKQGGCISGTSAGASAMTEHMVAGGPSSLLPTKGDVPLAAGLGFMQHAIIDQHFGQRRRLRRLLAVIAQNPFLLGLGIDEDTALVVMPDAELEVVGSGAVTVLDGREMDNRSYQEASEGEVLALTDVRLHLLPAGFRFALPQRRGRGRAPAVASVTFLDAIETIVANERA